MTPAIDLARKAGTEHSVHEYAHEPASDSYGLEAVEKLRIPEQRVFKTLVVSLDGRELAVGVIPVAARLSMKRIAKAAGAKKAVMAGRQDVERSTGYVLGGVSPLGQSTIFVSAGRRGLEIELNPQDLVQLLHGQLADLCQE